MEDVSQRIVLEKIEQLESDLKKQTAYIDSANRAMKTLRAEIKRATLFAAKLEGAIEAYRSAEKEFSTKSVADAQVPA